MKHLSFLLFLFPSLYLWAQNSNSSNNSKKTELLRSKSELDSLLGKFGKNKTIPEEYAAPILQTLSYFPELSDTKIVFKKSRIKTTMSARPTIASVLFKHRSKRTYVIRINTTKKDSIVTIDKVPFNAKIGLVGHELSHIVDYSEKGIWGIFKRLISYTNAKSKSKFEDEIDRMTIERGLGWQLYDWAYYVLYKSDATSSYKSFKEKIYMSPSTIKKIILQLSAHKELGKAI